MQQRQENKRKIVSKRTLQLIAFAFFFAVLCFMIVMIKSYTYAGVGIVYLYTILVSTFMFSRVTGSTFYKQKYERIDYSYEPTVTFVIPCKNEEKAIYHTIESCCLIDYPKKKVEIIAINDGSDDGTLKEMLRAKSDYVNSDIKIINFKQNKGKREGMYYGFTHGTGELIIQLDSDSFPEASSFRHLISPFKDASVGGSVGHTLPSNPDTNVLTKMQYAYYFMSFRALKATESMFNITFCLSGCYAAYRKSYILPHLDAWKSEKFMGRVLSFGDDRALSNQLIKNGYDTVYCANAQANTIVPDNLKGFLKQQNRWKKGWFINSMKASKFIYQRDKFVAFTYFFPLILITLITPLIALKALFINPIINHTLPTFYVAGIFSVSVLCMIHYYVYSPNKKYGHYMLLWSLLNMTILSYILPYALWNLFVNKNYTWGTR